MAARDMINIFYAIILIITLAILILAGSLFDLVFIAAILSTAFRDRRTAILFCAFVLFIKFLYFLVSVLIAISG